MCLYGHRWFHFHTTGRSQTQNVQKIARKIKFMKVYRC